MSLDPPPLDMYEILKLPLQAITCYQIQLPKMKQSCKPCTSNDTKNILRKQWSYVFAIVSQKISTHDRSHALLMPQKIVLTKKKIIDFTLLNCKQYCWFDFLFVHASYVFFLECFLVITNHLLHQFVWILWPWCDRYGDFIVNVLRQYFQV